MSRKLRRKPRTREQLLPLPAFVTKRLSMSHHSALALFRSGHGTLEHLAALAHAVYIARLMQCAEDPGATDGELFRAAETVLHECLMRAQGNGNWQLYPDEVAQIAPLLVRHDEQLATWRAERYHDAWYQLVAASAVVALLLVVGIVGVVIFSRRTNASHDPGFLPHALRIPDRDETRR